MNKNRLKQIVSIVTVIVIGILIYSFINSVLGNNSSSESKVSNSETYSSVEPSNTVSPEPTVATSASTGSHSLNQMLNSLQVANASGVAYDRGEWHHWDDITPCWNVREEVLYRDAVKDASLTLLDKNKNRTEDKAKACYVAGGTWNDPYTGQVFSNPSDLDIDHMIPLNYAAQHGGQSWDSVKKESYANNLDYSHHLIAVSASANRSKSDKGPGEWKPSNTSYYCVYAKDWISISNTWSLSVSQSDKDSLASMLATCE